MDEATFARPLRGGPFGVKPIGRCDREQTDVAAVFGHQPDRLKHLGGYRGGIGNPRSDN
jgi:hypothetical protein